MFDFGKKKVSSAEKYGMTASKKGHGDISLL